MHGTTFSHSPEHMTVPVWDYVFLGGDIPKTDVPPEALRLMSLQSIL